MAGKNMENKRRLIDADERLKWLEDNTTEEEWMVNQYNADWIYSMLDSAPTVDAVEVVHGYSAGDVCFYGYFGTKNKSLALVEIVKILNDERGVAELKFLKVFVDDTGNGLFDYLLRSGRTMNGSFEYLKNITPNCGERKEDVNA